MSMVGAAAPVSSPLVCFFMWYASERGRRNVAPHSVHLSLSLVEVVVGAAGAGAFGSHLPLVQLPSGVQQGLLVVLSDIVVVVA